MSLKIANDRRNTDKPLTIFLASFKFSMGGLAGQVRAPARRSEYLTRVEKAS
jgi:hypothetical protein